MNVHTGLVDEKEARLLAETGIDVASLDFIGSKETIKRVTRLNNSPQDYLHSIKLLMEAGITSVVPHICVGLEWGQMRGEADALALLKEINPAMIVILGLRPTKGTPMESAPSPTSEMVGKTVAATRLMFPSSSVALGCMIPQIDRHRIEATALSAGADRIVLPRAETISLAERMGLDVLEFDACCVLPTELEETATRLSAG